MGEMDNHASIHWSKLPGSSCCRADLGAVARGAGNNCQARDRFLADTAADNRRDFTATATGGDEAGFVELIADEEIFIIGLPFDLTLETSQSSVPAEGASIQLIATVLDDLAEPLEGAKVQFESSAGRVASL